MALIRILITIFEKPVVCKKFIDFKNSTLIDQKEDKTAIFSQIMTIYGQILFFRLRFNQKLCKYSLTGLFYVKRSLIKKKKQSH